MEKDIQNKDSKRNDGDILLADNPLIFFLDYEVRSSWWASRIGWGWAQKLSAKYFSWKVKRKYTRYKTSKMWDSKIKDFQQQHERDK